MKLLTWTQNRLFVVVIVNVSFRCSVFKYYYIRIIIVCHHTTTRKRQDEQISSIDLISADRLLVIGHFGVVSAAAAARQRLHEQHGEHLERGDGRVRAAPDRPQQASGRDRVDPGPGAAHQRLGRSHYPRVGHAAGD